MFGFKFLGNTHVPHRKGTSGMTPVKMTPPKEVVIPMAQHIGAPAKPIVNVGDTVKVGQVIAEASGYVSAPIHASVSGTVTKIDSCLKYDGRSVEAIVIESDGLMTPYEGLTPPTVTDVDSLVEAVKASGLVGLGGAGFPTAVKLAALGKGNIKFIVINAAECEPYITVDARTMLDNADYVLKGINLLKAVAPSIEKFIIGIESNKPECIANMKKVFEGDASVEVFTLPALYPQGSEKVIVHNTTRITVPEGKLPADEGVIVMNVTSLVTLAKYVETGMPLVERTLTLDGTAVKHPKNITAPIGTSVHDIIDFAGGLNSEPGKIIFGGPMTGRTAFSLDEPIVKTTNAITALTIEDSLNRKYTACIHCGRCVDACPHLLVPTEFTKSLRIENVDERMARLEEFSVSLCVECGCCSYVCPANRPLAENNRIAKNALRDYKAHKATLK